MWTGSAPISKPPAASSTGRVCRRAASTRDRVCDEHAAPRWETDQINTWISPFTAVGDGNRTLHAVGAGVRWRGADADILLETPDAPDASGEGRLLTFDARLPDMSLGWDVNLHSNVWGTNFYMWFGEDASFRFRLKARATTR